MQIGYDNKVIPNITCTKFLDLLIDNNLTWKNHIELLFNWLSTAYYVIWSVKLYLSWPTLITVYYALFRVVMTSGIIFWGNSTHSSKILKIQKRAVRIIMGRWRSESSRNLFKELKILPFKSQYINFFTFFFWLITKATLWQIKKNWSVHTIHGSDLHLPQTNLTVYQKGVYYSCVKIFNNILSDIKNTSGNFKRFTRILKHFLITRPFDTLEEYYSRLYMW